MRCRTRPGKSGEAVRADRNKRDSNFCVFGSCLSLLLGLCLHVLLITLSFPLANASRVMYQTPLNIQNPLPTSHRPTKPALPKQPITFLAIPSVSIQNNRLVWGNAQSSTSFPFSSYPSPPTRFPCQVPAVRIPRSRFSVTVPSAPSGFAIGMGPYPPILRYRSCRAHPGGLSGQASVW
jgi:hypothetical protein